MTEKQYVSKEIIDQLRDAVRQRDEAQFHAILRPLKAALPLQEQTKLLREVFAVLEETAEWRKFQWEGQLAREGFSKAEIAAMIDESGHYIIDTKDFPEEQGASTDSAKGLSFSQPKTKKK